MKQSEETRVHRMIEVEVGGGAEVQRCRQRNDLGREGEGVDAWERASKRSGPSKCAKWGQRNYD